MSKLKPILPILILIAALGIPGCGGSDENDSATAANENAPLSKAEFIRRADEICRKADRTHYNEARKYRNEHAKELAKLSPVASEEKLIRAIVLPSVVRQTEEIKALGVPKGDEGEVGKIIKALEVGVKKARKNPYGIELEVGSENPLDEVSDLARAYGFEECRNPA